MRVDEALEGHKSERDGHGRLPCKSYLASGHPKFQSVKQHLITATDDNHIPRPMFRPSQAAMETENLPCFELY
jgi:hypothetical protein